MSAIGDEFLAVQAAEKRIRDGVLVCYLKMTTYAKLLIAAFVAVFFLNRVWVINVPGYSQCTPMLEYGQWEGQKWTTVMCVPGQYQSEDEVTDCLSQDVTVVMIGGVRLRGVYNYVVELLGGEAVSGKHDGQFVDGPRHLDVSFYWHSPQDKAPLDLYRKLLEDKTQLQRTTAVLHAGCPEVDGPGGEVEEEEEGKKEVVQLLKKQKTLLKRNPKATVVWLPEDAVAGEEPDRDDAFVACSQESQGILATSDMIYLSPLATLNDHLKGALQDPSPERDNGPAVNLILNTFCNAVLHTNATCCVPRHRTTFMNILIAVLLLIAAFYAGIQLILITNTVKGLLPLLGVELDKEEEGIGHYIHHPMFSLPLKLGVVAMVIGYVIVVNSTSLLMVGYRTLDHMDMVLPCVALGLTFFLSIGFARDREALFSMEIAHESRGVAVVGMILLEVMDPAQLSSYTLLRALGALFLFVFGYEQFMEQVTAGGASSKGISQAVLRFGMLSFIMWVGGASPALSVYLILWMGYWFVFITVASTLYTSAVNQQNRGVSLMSAVCMPRKVAAIVMSVVVAIVTSLVIPSSLVDHATSLSWEVGMLRGDTVSVACGVVVGVVVCSVQEARSVNLQEMKNVKTPTVVILSLGGGILAIFVYLTVAFLQDSPDDYSTVHPFVIPLLLIGYLLVRVASPFQRAIKSHVLQFCGKAGIELFLLYHCVLLSGPYKAMLHLIPHHISTSSIILILTMLLLATLFRNVFETQPKAETKTSHGQRDKV